MSRQPPAPQRVTLDYSHADRLYTAACVCGEHRLFLSWDGAAAWRDWHRCR